MIRQFLGGRALGRFIAAAAVLVCLNQSVKAAFFKLPIANSGSGADSQFTTEFQYNDAGVALGGFDNKSALPTNASQTRDEIVTLFKLNSLTDDMGSPLLPNGVRLTGMIADITYLTGNTLATAGHTNSDGTKVYTDTTPTSTTVLHVGDYLFLTGLGRNKPDNTPSSPSTGASDGGYLLLTDTSKLAQNPFTLGGGVGSDNPQKLSLQPNGSTFHVDNNGTFTSGTPDNYDDGRGKAVNTAAGSVLLAATFHDINSLGTIVGAGGFTIPPFAIPAGTVFIEQVTGNGSPGTGGKDGSLAVTGLKSIGFLDVVGGNSATELGTDVHYNPNNTVGSVPQNPNAPVPGDGVGVTFTGNTTFVPATPSAADKNYTAFNGNSSDPGDYTTPVPEPSSFVLCLLGLGGLWLGRRRLLTANKAAAV
jgi:hypothetical protein